MPTSLLFSFLPLLIGMLVGKHSLSRSSHPGGPLVQGLSPGLLTHCWFVPSGDLQLPPSSPQPPAVLTGGSSLLPFLPFPYLPTLPSFQTLSQDKLFSVTALKPGLSSSLLCQSSSLYNRFFLLSLDGWVSLTSLLFNSLKAVQNCLKYVSLLGEVHMKKTNNPS